MKLSKSICAPGILALLSVCMTPEQIAERQRQEAAAREQQIAQIREQLISSCEQYG